MRIAHAHLGGSNLDLLSHVLKDRSQRRQEQVQRLAQTKGVGVVLDIHAGGAQVDDAAAHRALLGIGSHLRHQVVLDLGLDLVRALDVHAGGVGAQVGHLLRCHQAQFSLRLG